MYLALITSKLHVPLIGLLCLLPSLLSAQKYNSEDVQFWPVESLHGTYHFQNTQLDQKNARNSVQSFLKEQVEHLRDEEAGIVLEAIRESKTGIHYSFYQTLEGKQVLGTQLKVNLSKEGKLVSFYDFTFSHELLLEAYAFPVEAILQTPDRGDKAIIHEVSEEVWYYNGSDLVPAWYQRTQVGQANLYESVYGANGELIQDREIAYHFHTEKDSIGRGMVFFPDPVTSAGTVYGAPYIDDFDADIPELNAERKEMNLHLTFDEQSRLFTLANEAVVMLDIEKPTSEVPTSTSPEFFFTRGQQGFEDVNTFFHITNGKRYLDHLGYDNLFNEPVKVDAHALNGADQSVFSPIGGVGTLKFGEGFVDDAEDADVIIHEYGHAISFAAAPLTNTGTERNALDEAFGDFLAASYSKSISKHDWWKVFSWDGNNEFWPGRRAKTDDHYPEDLRRDIYFDADIWSGTIMQIWSYLGRDITTELMIESLFGYSRNMNMKQATRLYMQADSMLYDYRHKDVLCNIFFQRGLLNSCENIYEPPPVQVASAKLVGTSDFMANSGPAVLNFVQYSPTKLVLYDMAGRQVSSKEYGAGVVSDLIYPDNLKPGIYILRLEGGDQNYSWKMVRAFK